MTLNDIIVSALSQLDRGHDAQTLDIWRDKLTRFANDGVADLAKCVKPRRAQTVCVTNGRINTAALERDCMRVITVKRGEKALSFFDADGQSIIVPEAEEGETLEISYIYSPSELSGATDVPELPPHAHALIVTYVVARERISGDVAVQRGGNVYFQLYEAGKRALRPGTGASDGFKITNRW